MSGPRVVFVIDFSVHAGRGHLSRCLVLADALAAKGANCRFLITSADQVPMVPRFPLGALGSEGLPQGTDLAILDSYLLGPDNVAGMRPGTRTLAQIDDLARQPIGAEIVLNHNLYATDLGYADYGAALYMLGPRFALIDPAFSRLRAAGVPSQRRVLVSFGASQVAAVALPVAMELASRLGPDVTIDVTLPAGIADPDDGLPANLRIHRDAPMPLLLELATHAVVGLGVTFLEALAAGRTTIGVRLADNQALNASAAERLGLAVLASPNAAAIAEAIRADAGRIAVDRNPVGSGGAALAATLLLAMI